MFLIFLKRTKWDSPNILNIYWSQSSISYLAILIRACASCSSGCLVSKMLSFCFIVFPQHQQVVVWHGKHQSK